MPLKAGRVVREPTMYGVVFHTVNLGHEKEVFGSVWRMEDFGSGERAGIERS